MMALFITAQKKKVTRFDQYKPSSKMSRRRKTNTELVDELKDRGVIFTPKLKLKSRDIEELANQHNVKISVEEELIIEGWVGKPKGMLQILWERGFIDPSVPLSRYKRVPSKKKNEVDDDGNLTDDAKKFTLSYILANQPDFLAESTNLKFLADTLSCELSSVSILYSPKYHCEIAGEGVEYLWGFGKKLFHQAPLAKKNMGWIFICSEKML